MLYSAAALRVEWSMRSVMEGLVSHISSDILKSLKHSHHGMHTHTHTKYRSTRGVLMSEPQRQQDVVGNVTPDLRQVSPSPQTAPAVISITTDDKVPSWHS